MLQIKSIPAFNDNYIWLIENSDQRCAVVDPGDARPVLAYLKEHQLTLEAILITHHHNDHIGGLSELLRHYPKIAVVGPAKEAIPSLSLGVSDGDNIELFGSHFEVLSIEGHTSGHIGYYGNSTLFCGDVLFSAGCGRVFEGTMEQMYQSLSRLALLPEETLVYCAHEYTAGNVSFALAVEPENSELHKYRDEVNRLTAHQQPTLPTSIGREKLINPFLRTHSQDVIKSVSNRTKNHDPVSIFTALRQWKDEF
jgi:hydroxyacylglutathione hydrolase